MLRHAGKRMRIAEQPIDDCLGDGRRTMTPADVSAEQLGEVFLPSHGELRALLHDAAQKVPEPAPVRTLLAEILGAGVVGDDCGVRSHVANVRIGASLLQPLQHFHLDVGDEILRVKISRAAVVRTECDPQPPAHDASNRGDDLGWKTLGIHGRNCG
jgi:hypothetical protein